MAKILVGLMLICSQCTQKNSNWEIVNLDDRNDNINSIYAVIDSSLVHQPKKMNAIIKDINTQYPFSKQTVLIFYSKKEYANGKVELFMDNDYTTPNINIDQWMDNHVLGLIEAKDSIFISYPYSRTRKSHAFHIDL